HPRCARGHACPWRSGPHPATEFVAGERRARKHRGRRHGGRRHAGRRHGGRRSVVVNLPITDLLVIIGLTLLEGFFVASEIALVSVRRSRVDQLVEEGHPAAGRVRRLLDDPGRFLAVSQLGLTIIGFFASAYAAVSLVAGLKSVLQGAGMDAGG